MLARSHITGPETVEVHQFKQIAPKLGAMRYLKEIDGKPTFVEDCFNIPKDEVMDILNHVDAGKIVVATVVPDQSTDGDDHPEINSAVIQGEKASETDA